MTQFLKFADAIYAVGGAGKTLVFNMLEKDWILKKILEPSSNPNRCEIFIIDTCLDEENNDRKRIANIKKKIDEISNNYNENRNSKEIGSFEIGSISIEYHLLTKDMNLGTALSLTGDSVKDNVVRGTDADIWWMSDENIDPNWHKNIMEFENLKTMEFAKGVYRKRAVGKAIFYKAMAEKNDYVLPQGSNIDIICGIGGGTGAGIAIDLAKKIKSTPNKSNSNINFFGILSTLNESDEEKANCAAIISELEYLKVSGVKFNNGELNGKDIFANNILVPIELTNYEGNRVLNPQSKKLLDEFDSVFPNIIISYHNTGSAEYIFENQPSFAPFIIAVPQAVRYNVDYIKNIKDDITSKMDLKRESLTNERKIYSQVQTFINTYKSELYDKQKPNSLNDGDKAFLYEKRYLKFREILNMKYFEDLQYENILLLKEAIRDIGTQDDEAGIHKKVGEFISHIISTMEASGMDENGNLPTSVDSSIYKILHDDIYAIKDIELLLAELNSLNDDKISGMLKKIIMLDEKNLSLMLNQAKTQCEKFQEEKTYLSNGIDDLESDLSTIETESENYVNDGYNIWKLKMYDCFVNLDSIKESKNNLYSSNDELKNSFDAYLEEINSAKLKQINEIDTSKLERSISKFIPYMKNISDSQHLEDEDKLHDAINDIRELRKNFRKSRKKIPFVEKILPGSGPKEKEIDEAKNNISKITSRWANNDRFSLYLKDGAVVFNYDGMIDSLLESFYEQKAHEMKKYLLDEYPNADTMLIESLVQDISKDEIHSSNAFEKYVVPVIKSNYDIESKVRNTTNEIKEKKIELDKTAKQLDVYSKLENLIKDVSRYYNTHSNNLIQYNSFISGDDAPFATGGNASPNIKSYVVELEPTDISRVLVSGSDINNIVMNASEKNSLKKHVNDIAMNMVNQQYNGLVNLIVEEGTKQWDQIKLNIAVISKAKDIDISDNTSSNLRNSYGIEKSALNRWYIEAGDDWSVNLMTFVSGIPVDNIYNFVNGSNGYFIRYNTIRDDPDKMSFFHNSVLLEKGEYVERQKIFDLVNQDKGIFVQPKQDIKATLKENLRTVSLSEVAGMMENRD